MNHRKGHGGRDPRRGPGDGGIGETGRSGPGRRGGVPSFFPRVSGRGIAPVHPYAPGLPDTRVADVEAGT